MKLIESLQEESPGLYWTNPILFLQFVSIQMLSLHLY